MKGCYVTKSAKGKKVNIKALFRDLIVGQVRVIQTRRPLLGQNLYLSGIRLSNGDLRIVACNENRLNAVHEYMQREEIEYLFGALKTRGFNFESTHLKNYDRISNLLTVMTIAYCWSYRCGDLIDDVKPIKCKSHGRKIKSVFRYGYDVIRKVLTNIECLINDFLALVKIICGDGKVDIGWGDENQLI